MAKSGIYVPSAIHGIITNNTVIDCDGWGISTSKAIAVSHNIVKNCYGMAAFDASGTPFFNNTIIDGTYGFFNSGCDDCTFYNNTFSNTSAGGFLLQFDNFNNTYKNNNIINCSTGMFIQIRTTNCTFLGNTIRGSSSIGIEVSTDSENNTFSMNRFETNLVQAVDNNGTNWWDNGTHGNYWDTYGSLGPGYVDINDDGLGDIARYDISVNTDWHPIWNDGPNPPTIVLITPLDNDFRPLANRTFSVRINDTNLDTMWYTIANGPVFTFTSNGSFNGAVWNASYASTPDGQSFHVLFHANDTAGNVVSSGLHVVVNHAPVITPVSPLDSEHRGVGDRAFIVYITDASLDSMWYTLGTSGGQAFPFTTNGSFDQVAWTAIFDTHADGEVFTVYFHANDTHGEERSVAVAIVVSKPASIPIGQSFILFLLLGIGALVVTTLRKYRSSGRINT